jgi:acyl-CoA thioesterase-1
MNAVILPFIDGTVLFQGMFLAVVSSLLVTFKGEDWWWRFFLRLGVVLGAILVVLSATPAPLWMYVVWLALLAGAQMYTERYLKERRSRAAVNVLMVLLVLLSGVMAWKELPYHLDPHMPTSDCSRLYVIGDSLGIGADSAEQNWPQILGAGLKLPVNNFSFGGAKVGTSLSNAERIEGDDVLVLIEVSGNDILFDTKVEEYESGLEALLQAACTGKRRVVMLESPLAPFYNGYGVVQRKLTAKYGVTLIPKRYFGRVLCAKGATMDGLHFSQAGHNLMAEVLLDLFD